MDAWLTIRQVTEQTGVPAATLRAWERRYGFPVPQRTTGGHRRYSATDVRRLQDAHNLVEEGWIASAAVRQVTEGATQPEASTVLTIEEATAPAGPTDVDVEVLEAVSRAQRALIRLSSPDGARSIVGDVVQNLGGELVDATEATADCLPIDVSLGLTDPVLASAPAYTLARMRLESVLPSLVEDALLVVARLQALEECQDR